MSNLKSVAKGRFIVIVACGWARKPQNEDDYEALCPSVVQRLEAAFREIQSDDLIGVTGDVPYSAADMPEATIAQCMLAWLRNKGIKNDIVKLGGLNAFSESFLTTAVAADAGFSRVHLFSSDFYLEAYADMWKAWAERKGVCISITSVVSGDWVTDEVRKVYSNPFGLVKILARVASIATPLGHLARLAVDVKTLKRKTVGFALSGCDQIG